MNYKFNTSVKSYIFYKLAGIVCGVIAYIFIFGTPFFPAFAATTGSYTSRIDSLRGSFVGTEADSTEGDLKLQPAGTWNTRVWKTPTLTLSVGSAIATDGTNVYVMTDRDNRFSKYTPQEDKFKELALPRQK